MTCDADALRHSRVLEGVNMDDYVYLTYYNGIMVITGALHGIGFYEKSPFVDGRIIWTRKHSKL